MMTQDEQRIAIAKWMGWTHIKLVDSPAALGRPSLMGYADNLSGELKVIPNYPLDLNAMHEAEKKLLASEHTDMLGDNYLQVLWQVCEDIYFKQITVCVATSAQRSEALCRVIVPERFQ